MLPARISRPNLRWFAFLICAIASVPTAASATPSPRRAHAAHVLKGTATAHLSPTSVEGSKLIEDGPISGALTGSAHAELRTGAKFSANFTIHTHSGSISGHGTATPHGSGRYESFSGTLTATSGTGRYAHIKGHGGLYGVFDRRTDKVTIQTTGGELTY